MSRPSRENLLGFLLGALAPEEQRQVEVELNNDPALDSDLARLRARLDRMGLAEPPRAIDPPRGLADRTCDFVAAYAAPTITPAGALALQAAPHERRFTWSDFVTMAAIVVAAASLFFPALSYSRFNAQIDTCQNQLRLIGYALHEYSNRQPDHSFPAPEADGNRAAAGIVAPILVSHQLADSRMFLCPASSVSRGVGAFRVPLPDELDAASGATLKGMLASMGGDYGYSMGYVDDGKLMPTRDARRAAFALAGDAPSNLQPRRVSANHRARGQNLLCEDGHVKFLSHLPSPQVLDDPYHNRDGWIAPGVDKDDAVLGASNDKPLPVMLISDGPR